MHVSAKTGGVLVTGGTGFVGRHLISHLKLNAPRIAVLASTAASARDPDVEYYEADIRDRESVASLIKRISPQAIYHLAGISEVHASWSDPRTTYEVNVAGTYNVFEAAMTLSTPPTILNVSTGQVYGASPTALTENSLVRPANPYAASKAMAELLAVQYARAVVGGIVTARAFNHTGPGQTSNFFFSAVAKQFVEVETGMRPPTLFVGNINVRRDFTDVRDVVRAYGLLVERGKIGEVYNICSGTAVRLADVVQLFQTKAGITLTIENDPSKVRTSDAADVSGDPTKLREQTGWLPAIPLEQTVEDMLAYWRSEYRHLLAESSSTR